MDRSEFIKKGILSGFGIVAGSSVMANSLLAGTSDPYDWKPGDAITINKVQKSEQEWKNILSDNQYYVLREAETEKAFNNPYWDNKKDGIYFCAGCTLPLYSSKTKFKSGTGWPSFYKPVDSKVVHKVTDNSAGMTRGEIKCAQCNGHIGHVFNDGPKPTGLRYCMNSYALHFKEMDV